MTDSSKSGATIADEHWLQLQKQWPVEPEVNLAQAERELELNDEERRAIVGQRREDV